MFVMRHAPADDQEAIAAVRVSVAADGPQWGAYHAGTAERPPRPLLLRALRVTGPGAGRAAVDLGCGSGADTLALAERGWLVTAVDRDAAAISLLGSRAPATVSVACAPFTEADLPPAHLVFAGYSLPFCDPAGFPGAWERVRAALLPGGVFAGQFLGPRDGWAGRDGMSFHDAGQVAGLLDGLEVLYRLEKEWTAPAGGRPKRWHATGVVARQPQRAAGPGLPGCQAVK